MRIVIVEDEAPIREGMAKLLHQIDKKYEVVGKAVDGQSGYELICSLRPDLAIVDIRVPNMDGLSMVRKLRERKMQCQVLVLTAYSEFDYARQAIELGIVSYLLKPLKIPELKVALRQVELVLQKEENREYAFSLDNIFLSCMNGQLEPDEYFHKQTYEKYGFTVRDPAELFLIWLGDGFEEQRGLARELLEHVATYSVKYSAHIREAKSWKSILMILYRQPAGESQRTYYKRSVMPMLCSNLKRPMVCVWRKSEQILDISRILPEMLKEMEWNLWFPDRFLICREEIDRLHVVPVKYPLDLEDQAKWAVRRKDWKKLFTCYERLYECMMQEPHLPSQIKECLIRFNWSMIRAQKDRKEESELQIQNILQKIAAACTWEQISLAMREFMSILNCVDRQEEDPSVSDLIQRAKDFIRKYYNQGITLEETARRLYVSEEYLSMQFKKETGNTFTETVRHYRIDRVKTLLVDTHLRMNQIADLAGYSDPKYMSRVFREEVGMLPSEYRKIHSEVI